MSNSFDRDALERKDRAQLVEIATALGVKVPARAKKATIIDLLAGTDGATPTDAEAPGEPISTLSEAEVEPAPADQPAPEEESAPAEESAPEEDPASGADPEGAEEDGVDGADSPEEGESQRSRRNRRKRSAGQPGESAPDLPADAMEVQGLLDLRDDGYGFLRVNGFAPSRDDVYVSVKQCRQFGLRKGDHLAGAARPAGHREKNPAMLNIQFVNGLDALAAVDRPRFDERTPAYPNEAWSLASAEVAALFNAVPVGKGSRMALHYPYGSNPMPLLHAVAGAFSDSEDETHFIVVLVDARPEDVAEFRSIVPGVEVVAATFDRQHDEHAMVAELTTEHAKRMVEYGNDVVLLVHGLTQVARAYNTSMSHTGRIAHQMLDAGALAATRRVFGAARRVEEGGSLTVLATLVANSPHPIDQIIEESFEGAANAVVVLETADGEWGPVYAVNRGVSRTERTEELGAEPRAQGDAPILLNISAE